jgi:hypothetical protein
MDYGKIWDLRGKNGGRNDSANPEKLKSLSSMEVGQRCIIKFLHFKGLKLGDIVMKLSTLYGEDAYPQPSMKYWLQQLQLGRTDFTTQHVGGRPDLDDTDVEILSVLRISPFSSVRTIADSLGIPISMVYLHLVEKIGFKNDFLRWVPHMLTEARSCGRKESNSRGSYFSSLKANEALTSAIL